jgi:hypothetical protein
MNFIDWDPVVRSLVFGGIFLICLVPVLWQLYETMTGVGRWSWFSASLVALLLTTPAIVVGAANLEESKETLLTVVSWLAIGGALLTIGSVGTYAAFGRSEPPVEFPPMPYAPAPVYVSPELPPAPTEIARPLAPRPVKSDAFLFVKDGPDKGKQYPLAQTVLIGRGSDCEVALDDGRVSSQHAQVKEASGQFVFTDLQSSNGSFLIIAGREEPIRAAQVLVDGDEIRLGRTLLEFVDTRKGKRQ